MMRRWWWLGLTVLLIVLLAAAGDPARMTLRYQRDAIAGGEYWRLVTAHLVHANWRHALQDLAGLVIVCVLLRNSWRPRDWVVIVLTSLLAMDLGFWFLMPGLSWYVGISGLIYGLLAAGALAWWQQGERRLALILSAIVLGKIGWEQWQGALPLMGDLPVVVNAHLYGAAGGLVGALLRWRHLPRRA